MSVVQKWCRESVNTIQSKFDEMIHPWGCEWNHKTKTISKKANKIHGIFQNAERHKIFIWIQINLCWILRWPLAMDLLQCFWKCKWRVATFIFPGLVCQFRDGEFFKTHVWRVASSLDTVCGRSVVQRSWWEQRWNNSSYSVQELCNRDTALWKNSLAESFRTTNYIKGWYNKLNNLNKLPPS